MSKFFTAAIVVLAVVLGFTLGLAQAGGFVVPSEEEPKIVEVTHTETVREQPIVHNNTVNKHIHEPTVYKEGPAPKAPPVLPDTGGQDAR
jgi:hypothetical protein